MHIAAPPIDLHLLSRPTGLKQSLALRFSPTGQWLILYMSRSYRIQGTVTCRHGAETNGDKIDSEVGLRKFQMPCLFALSLVVLTSLHLTTQAQTRLEYSCQQLRPYALVNQVESLDMISGRERCIFVLRTRSRCSKH